MSRPTPLAGLTVVDQAYERGELCGRLLAVDALVAEGVVTDDPRRARP